MDVVKRGLRAGTCTGDTGAWGIPRDLLESLGDWLDTSRAKNDFGGHDVG